VARALFRAIKVVIVDIGYALSKGGRHTLSAPSEERFLD
jgi:hypothetical protein